MGVLLSIAVKMRLRSGLRVLGAVGLAMPVMARRGGCAWRSRMMRLGLPLVMVATSRGCLFVATWHVVAVLAFMIVHFAFATPMLVTAADRDHRVVLLSVHSG